MAGGLAGREVINIILLLTFNKVDSANINEKYAMKVANDYAYQRFGQKGSIAYPWARTKESRGQKAANQSLPSPMYLSG